jgi:hypothetical protein
VSGHVPGSSARRRKVVAEIKDRSSGVCVCACVWMQRKKQVVFLVRHRGELRRFEFRAKLSLSQF